jgi:vacuolar protein sorting-associated protein 13B
MLVIVNNSTKMLDAVPFYIDNSEKMVEIKKTEIADRKANELHQNSKHEPIKQGDPISLFFNIKKTVIKKKNANNLTYYVTLGMTKSNTYSCPLKIQTTTRKCLNISNGLENFSIAISILKHNEQFYLSIFDDENPKLSIKNNTDFNLYIAQTDTKNTNLNYIIPHKEVLDEKNGLKWFQIIPSRQMIFYTPPIYTENFPEITHNNYGLIFACVSGDNFIRWSMPVKIDETKTIIINLPMFGDVKMIIDCKSQTSQIIVNYINSEQPVNEDQQVSNFSTLSSLPSQQYSKTFGMNMRRKNKRNMNINCYLESINVTVYRDNESKRTNLMSLNIEEITADYSIFGRKLRVDFSRIQVDNELFHTGNYDFDFPVVLCNKTITQKSNFDSSTVSLWDISKIFQHHRSNIAENFSIVLEFYENDDKLENVILKTQPIRIYIEDTFINVITELIDDCLPKKYEQKMTFDEEFKILEGLVIVPTTIFDQAHHLAEPVQLKMIKIEALHILISVHTCIRMYIALDHSPLDFATYEKRDVYTVPMKLGNSIGMHYLSSAIFGAGWVVGSLEILGSPSGLARSLTSGFKDFVSLPAQGLLRGPWGFLVGLTHGSVSLVRNVTEGTVNSVTKLANSLARNLDRLTLDSDHIYLKTDASRRYRPQGVTEGFQQGLTGLGISLLGAIGGLARHPLQAKSAVDIFTGVGKGLLGVFTKVLQKC